MPGSESETLGVWISALTDSGKVRPHNEDYIGYLVPEDRGVRASHGALMVVCDGVGGGSAGEVASERAVHRILRDYYAQSTETEIEDRLIFAVQQANAELYAENQRDPDVRPMSTTVVAALILGRELLVAHAGDSRAYLARGGQITQLTTDHSWVAEMVEAGDLTPEEAAKHPWRNRITRGLGLKEEIDLDVQEFALEARDVLLLCSDGLTRHVSDEEILAAAMQYPPEGAVQQLVRLANMRGGKDNISVLGAEALTESELTGRLSQAEVADEETQVPVRPKRRLARRGWRRFLPWVAVCTLLGLG
jgi:serine/threonine protein phosphatase PrpC